MSTYKVGSIFLLLLFVHLRVWVRSLRLDKLATLEFFRLDVAITIMRSVVLTLGPMLFISLLIHLYPETVYQGLRYYPEPTLQDYGSDSLSDNSSISSWYLIDGRAHRFYLPMISVFLIFFSFRVLFEYFSEKIRLGAILIPIQLKVFMETDIVIVGGGAGGLSAAREAIRRGASATIISDGPLGGDCTFTGCVPSKTVIEAANSGLSFSEAFSKAGRVVDHIASSETAEVLKAEGIDVIDGRGIISDSKTIVVGSKTIKANKAIVLALGSKPALPKIDGLNDINVLTTETIWKLKTAPKTLAIIGGGAIGCELGQALAKLGVAVTLLETMPRILSKEEPSVSKLIEEELTKSGVAVITDSRISSVKQISTQVQISFENKDSILTDQVFVSAGRSPNTTNAGLAEAGVELDSRGFIKTKPNLATSLNSIYAVGDVSGNLAFTHAADHMGRIAVNNILSRFSDQKFDSAEIPWVTFTSPEVGRIGMTESEAAQNVPGAMVAELPLTEHDRAITAAETVGFIKLIAGPRRGLGMTGGGKIIGATIVAPRAGEMISEISLAVKLNAFVGRLAQTIHPYPSWSYGIAKCAGQFFTTVEGRSARKAVIKSE